MKGVDHFQLILAHKNVMKIKNEDIFIVGVEYQCFDSVKQLQIMI